jgi:hypothetical protein
MSETIQVTAQDIQNVSEAVNSLKLSGMIFIIVLSLIIVSYFVISKILTWKNQKMINEHKNQRIEAQINSLNAINDNLNLMNETLVNLKADSKNHSEGTLSVQNHLISQLDTMSKKIKGIIPDVDASKILNVYFNTIIRKEISYLVETQIIKNGWKESSDFIKRRMKLNIREVLDRCQDELKGLKLPLSVRSVFLTYSDGEGERYQIADIIMDSIEPILARGGDKEKNIEEAKIIIESKLKDYLTPVMRELTDSPTDRYQALSKDKTKSSSTKVITNAVSKDSEESHD